MRGSPLIRASIVRPPTMPVDRLVTILLRYAKFDFACGYAASWREPAGVTGRNSVRCKMHARYVRSRVSADAVDGPRTPRWAGDTTGAMQHSYGEERTLGKTLDKTVVIDTTDPLGYI